MCQTQYKPSNKFKFLICDRVKTPEGWIGEITEIGLTPDGLYQYLVDNDDDKKWFTEDQLSKPRGRKPKHKELFELKKVRSNRVYKPSIKLEEE